ncbi:copper chaperone PCu(A)C [Streptomyces sp. NPDC051907]|uniref:copper chaperone PCu(A)C n=1 Tax=Streptomyces sp. NPDC051907 TaxID=3155284 RepID=UPI00341CC8BC
MNPLSARAAAILVPAGACAVTLALLFAYVRSGAAGAPPAEVTVTRARVVQPLEARDTVAYLDLRNTGGTDATLTSVSSPGLGGSTMMLSRDVETDGAGRMKAIPSLTIPAGSDVKMSPSVADVMIEDPPRWRLGEKVEFVLRFLDGTTLTTTAEVVLPSAGPSSGTPG